ncbi:MAG: two-component sensor histidine kinase [uncultured bacterium]|nr:MAG: two-component sensor histidine kinase [uncultured bacterium]
MKELIKKGLFFVKNNPTIIYSLLLIFVIIAALFLNSYFILTRFQDNLDKTLRTKAVLAEDIIAVVAADYFSDLSLNKEKFEEKITQIQKHDPEIVEMSVYTPGAIEGEYLPVISSKTIPQEVNIKPEVEKISQNAIRFALSGDDAIAYISNINGVRFWSVVKAVKGEDGLVKGALLLKLSLAENDSLVKKTIFQVYLLSIGAMVIVLLLVFNHIRLFAFEVKAKKLEEIDKMKDDFISMASHELKSPLTAIKGYAELLADIIQDRGGDGDNGIQQRKYLKNIDISVNRLTTLVEDLLDVSRLQQNRVPFENKEIDLAKIAREIVAEMKVVSDEKGLELKETISKVSKVSADPERLKQIAINLLSNAIKYTPKGSVEVQVKEDEKNVYFIVADTGLGISAENMKKLFTKFYRIQTQETAQISGTGLGLWIAREMAQKMGGDLKVESIVGVGSHFTLELKK